MTDEMEVDQLCDVGDGSDPANFVCGDEDGLLLNEVDLDMISKALDDALKHVSLKCFDLCVVSFSLCFYLKKK